MITVKQLAVHCIKSHFKKISTSNHMFGSTIWDKLPECVFEHFEIA